MAEGFAHADAATAGNEAGALGRYERKRRFSFRGDDNFIWLITFADLMTILLVFSFVLFMVLEDGKPDSQTGAAPVHDAQVATLFPVAHATTCETPAVSAAPEPARAVDYAQDTRMQLPEEEVAFFKQKVFFEDQTNRFIREGKSVLQDVVRHYRRNPGARIIVWGLADMPLDDPSLSLYSSRWLLSLQRTRSIVACLCDELGVEKEKISIQNAAGPESDSILVSVSKAFWWLQA